MADDSIRGVVKETAVAWFDPLLAMLVVAGTTVVGSVAGNVLVIGVGEVGNALEVGIAPEVVGGTKGFDGGAKTGVDLVR